MLEKEKDFVKCSINPGVKFFNMLRRVRQEELAATGLPIQRRASTSEFELEFVLETA